MAVFLKYSAYASRTQSWISVFSHRSAKMTINRRAYGQVVLWKRDFGMRQCRSERMGGSRMKTGWLSVVVLSGLMASCTVSGWSEQQIGGERDGHGCLVAAGYTFSMVQDACIRVFESGVQVQDARRRDGLASFVVFSLDGERAELFLPDEAGSVVLTRRVSVWENDRYILRQDRAEWVLERMENGRQ